MTLPATELLDARSDALDTWPPGVLLQSLWEGQLAAVAAIGPALPALAAAAIAATGRLRAHASGRLIYTGAGSSARLGAQDGAELAPTFDWPDARLLLLPAGGPAALTSAREGAEDDMTAAIEAVAAHRVGSADVMIAVAASGATPFTLAAASAARATGALTIAIANSPGAPLLSACEHGVLIATGPEPVAGSTRMKAGTAQKVALNLLSTGVMIGLHRTHRGRMVEMRATNAKLAARAVRMVAELAGVDHAVAEAALAQTDGRCKPAVLVACGLDPRAAASALAATGGNLRAALALPPRRP